ncbi:antibiotic biosynthesis monooxygenase family protein [Arthrobacter liuii]|uniref:ABM domain-containing protein n=1 Tax=Arthrobacter liuii TaxID=1476996 RepID=A0ABQ2B1F7_9MICC|nr:antibiotic biosynthesis monooxygenase family protein [Arthrobacter liuii]GGI02212.1 hypothetical protein GCM10007170_43410 [Arthrobacter liuii]
MVFEHAHFTVHEGMGEGFESAYPSVREALLQAPGCQSVALHRSPDRPGVYLLRVRWDTLADHTERFPETEQSRQVLAAIGPFVASSDLIHFEETMP